jgi:hypothetical protein
MGAIPQGNDFLAQFKLELRWLLWRNEVVSSVCHSALLLQDCEQRVMMTSGLEYEI